MKWSVKKWLTYSGWTIWAIALMIAFGINGWAYPDGNNPTCSTTNKEKNSSMCGLVEVLIRGIGSVKFLSSFILAGFLLSTRQLYLVSSKDCILCTLWCNTKPVSDIAPSTLLESKVLSLKSYLCWPFTLYVWQMTSALSM